MATVVHETLQLDLINQQIADNTIHALTLLACVPAKRCISAFIDSFSNAAGARHVLCVFSCCHVNTLLLSYNIFVSTPTSRCSMLLGGRPVWTLCSSCTLIVRLLFYHPLCLYSSSQCFHVARDTACVDPCTLMTRLLSNHRLCLHSYSK